MPGINLIGEFPVPCLGDKGGWELPDFDLYKIGLTQFSIALQLA